MMNNMTTFDTGYDDYDYDDYYDYLLRLLLILVRTNDYYEYF